jgi:hypothetical protein
MSAMSCTEVRSPQQVLHLLCLRMNYTFKERNDNKMIIDTMSDVGVHSYVNVVYHNSFTLTDFIELLTIK